MTFNPSKTTRINLARLRRARLWYEVKLYLIVAAIIGIPGALLLWLLFEYWV